jgi:guanylate kinase
MLNDLKKGELIVFAAPSGAGKSSLIKEIISNNENIELSVSATTRSPREGETHGKDYFFITDNEFNDLKKKDAFIESADVHGHQYGTLKAFVEEKLENNISVVLDIDVQGFIQISNSIKEVISIFIIPPSLDELKKRLILRGLDADDVINRRMENAIKELKQAKYFDYIVLNDDFNRAFNDITSIIFDKNYEYNETYNKNILKDLLD